MSKKRVYAKISINNIRKNILEIKKILQNNTLFMCVIKADGYGHGAIKVGEAISDIVDYYGVATFEEAIELKHANIKTPIILIGNIFEEDLKILIEKDIILTISNINQAIEVNNIAKTLNKIAKIHIKIDTGMGRLGFYANQALPSILEMEKFNYIEINGIFTHFSVSEDLKSDFTKTQLKLFNDLLIKIKENNINIPIIHCANSGGTINYENSHFNMVRCGILTYGLSPSGNNKTDIIKKFPALSLYSTLTSIKTAKKGNTIGYGRTYTVENETKIGVIPVGYADGYSRKLGNKGRVLINGEYANIIGTICMDQFMVDLTNIKDVKIGDEVVLIGNQNGKTITVDDIAEFCETINYEIICGISKRVPRIYE